MKAFPIIIPPGPGPARTGDDSPYPYEPVPPQDLTGGSLGEIIDSILAAMEGWPEGQVADVCFIIKDDDGNQIASVEPDIRPLALHLYIGGND